MTVIKIHRPMEQALEPRNRSKHVQASDIWQGKQEHSEEEKESLLINGGGVIGYSHIK